MAAAARLLDEYNRAKDDYEYAMKSHDEIAETLRSMVYRPHSSRNAVYRLEARRWKAVHAAWCRLRRCQRAIHAPEVFG